MRTRVTTAAKKQQNENVKCSSIIKVKKERVQVYVTTLENDTSTMKQKDKIFQLDIAIVVKEEFMNEKYLFLDVSTVGKGEQTQTITLGFQV
jgi:hypothetical protein